MSGPGGEASVLFGAVGWALVHSLWQGAAAAALLWLALHRLEAGRPEPRVRLSALALLAIAAAVPLTAIALPAYEPGALAGTACRCGSGITDAPLDATGAGSGARAEAVTSLLGWIAVAWLAGSAANALRLVGGLLRLRGLRRRAERVPGLEAGRWPVLASGEVSVPLAFGIRRPVILLPRRCLSELSRAELGAVVAHEAAHLERRDFAANLWQACVEAFLYFHPAARWISTRLRREREHVCDDAAVAACGDRLAYARALCRLEEMRAGRPALALAAGGASVAGRIRRLASDAGRSAAPARLRGAIAATLVLAAAGTGWLAVPLSGTALASYAAGREGSRWTVSAVDPAGEFTLTIENGRALAATVGGKPLAAAELRQVGDRVFLRDPARGDWFDVRVTAAGIRWSARPPQTGGG